MLTRTFPCSTRGRQARSYHCDIEPYHKTPQEGLRYLASARGRMGLELIPAVTEREVGSTWDRLPVDPGRSH